MILADLVGPRFSFRGHSSKTRLIVAALLAAAPHLASGEGHAIDPERSTMTVHVERGGVLGAFGHDHEIAVPIADGTVDPDARRVEFRVNAASLRVRDPDASEKDRAEVQKTMLGPEVLDAEKYREIRFQSTGAEKSGDGWTVQGNLTIHGMTKPVTVAVREKDGAYTGSTRLKQSAFGMKPIKIAGGAVRVKDELKIDFQIQLAR